MSSKPRVLFVGRGRISLPLAPWVQKKWDVLGDELDFAVVPAFEGRIGLKSRLLVRDREVLLSGPKRGLAPLAPVRMRAVSPP